MRDANPDPAKDPKQRREAHPNRQVHRDRFAGDTSDPYDAYRDAQLTGDAPASRNAPKYSVRWWNQD